MRIDSGTELMNLINSSSATEEHKAFWKELIKKIPKDVADRLLKYFKEFPGHIDRATYLLNLKTRALETGDKTLSEQALFEEESILREIIES